MTLGSVKASGVGGLLRHWRQTRGYSQLALAEEAEVSTRHISYVENGRSAPSREMVLVLASALDLPLRERNALLEAAGFAAVYSEHALEHDALDAARRAVDFLLERHEPYPAVAMDRHWNVLAPNAAAARLLTPLAGKDVDPTTLNAIVQVFDPQGLRPHIVNWREVAADLIARLHREAAVDDAARDLLARVLRFEDVPKDFHAPNPQASASPLLKMQLRLGDLELAFFSALTTLGTVHDVTLQELRIETWFPADQTTKAFFDAH